MQRAFSGPNIDIMAATATTLRVSCQSVEYIDSIAGTTYKSVDASPSIDASPREIVNALVTTIIASQPPGFNLQERDVVVIALDRG